MTTCSAQCSPATLNIWPVPFHFNMHITVTSCLILRILTAPLNAHWLIVSTLQMTTSSELSAACNEETAWQHWRPSLSRSHYAQWATTRLGANLFASGMHCTILILPFITIQYSPSSSLLCNTHPPLHPSRLLIMDHLSYSTNNLEQ